VCICLSVCLSVCLFRGLYEQRDVTVQQQQARLQLS